MKKQNSLKRKGQIRSTIVAIILILLFLFIVISIFFGDGLLKQGFDRVKELIKGVPEVDQTKNEQDFFRTNDIQITFLNSWNNKINYALKGSAPYGGCIMTLDSIEAEGFYKKGANYNLYIEQKGTDVDLKMTRYAKQDVEKDEAKTEVPVVMVSIPNVQLCVIQGTSATAFYNEFNDIKSGETPDMSKITPVPVNYILISSGKEEDKDKKRAIGYSNAATKPLTEEGYTWAELFKKKDRTIIYALRISEKGTEYVCFFPTYNDRFELGSKCGGVSEGFIQTDCFDSDGGDKSLKANFEATPPLIPAYYKCSDTPPVAATTESASTTSAADK